MNTRTSICRAGSKSGVDRKDNGKSGHFRPPPGDFNHSKGKKILLNSYDRLGHSLDTHFFFPKISLVLLQKDFNLSTQTSATTFRSWKTHEKE